MAPAAARGIDSLAERYSSLRQDEIETLSLDSEAIEVSRAPVGLARQHGLSLPASVSCALVFMQAVCKKARKMSPEHLVDLSDREMGSMVMEVLCKVGTATTCP
jgi:hypothetical protein